MITNTGKSILSKYLIGQVNTYASHISIGCGSKPLATTDTHDISEYAVKPVMDFEMIRLPIVSRGYVEESSVFSTTGTIGTVSGSGPYTATITGLYSTSNILAGETITATNGTGSLGAGTVIVTSVVSATSIVVSSTASMTAGTITDLSKIMTKISLIADLPSTERYEITEVGVWSNKQNPVAGTTDGRILFNFNGDNNERWQYHDTAKTDVAVSQFATNVPGIDSANTAPVFTIRAEDPIFDNALRTARYERPRYLSSGIIINANTAPNLTSSGGQFTLGTGDKHIDYDIPNGLTFDKNASDDQLKLAFSIIRANASASIPESFNLKILVQFLSSEESTAQYANMQIEITNDDISGISGNSYFVVTKKLSELFTSSKFLWSQVRIARVAVKATTTDPHDYYVNLDALRFENISDIAANPNYGMIGYTKVQKGDPGVSIVKDQNFAGNVEFRFIVDAGDA